MRYVGMQTQIQRNNRMSVLLLLMFPIIILATVYMFFFILGMLGGGYYDAYGNWVSSFDIDEVNHEFITIIPWVILIVGVWFLIAYKDWGDAMFQFSHFEVDLREPDSQYRTLYIVYRYDTTVS